SSSHLPVSSSWHLLAEHSLSLSGRNTDYWTVPSAALIADDDLARAGLRLTTEAGLDIAGPAFRKWVELVSRLVDTAIADGQLPASAAQRLAENLCAGFIGAIQVIQVLGDPGDFTSRIDDLVNAYLISDM
ncbi:hypothetical protein ACFC0F_33305, partial [Rhodococcus qingshengii]